MQRSVRSLVLLVLLLLPAIALAQSIPTATLSGRVTVDNAPLPGATVTVKSPNLQGTRSTTTGAGGDYIFPFLPPGVYTVTFELEGMQKVMQRVTLTAAREDRVDVALTPSKLAESISVTADTPMTASVESTQVSTNFSQSLIEQLPVNRDQREIALLSPGVNNNGPGYVSGGNITISGAMSYDSLFLVNGVIVNENLRGQPQALFIEDAIQETTVLTGGISAEYGHFTGGVVSTITKSGGNDLKGSFRTSFTNESWSAKTPLTADQADKTNPMYEATVGGPALRDRLWFFGAGRSAKTSDVRQTAPGLARAGDQDANGKALVAGTPIPPIVYPHGTKEQRFEAKLTGAITPKHTVIATYTKISASEQNQTGYSVMDLDSLVKSRQTPNTLFAANYNGSMTDKLFIEGQYSRKEFAFLHSGSPYFDLIKGTMLLDRARGTRFWSPTFRATPNGEHRNHTLYTANATYFWSTPQAGSHQIKAGYEHFLEVRDVNNYQNGSDYRISISQSIVRGDQVFGRFTGGSSGTTTRISWYPIFVLSQGSQYAVNSVYLNDRWSLNNHWRFNLGVRYDGNDAVSGDRTFKIATKSTTSPRLAAHYDFTGTGLLIASATYGQYVGRLSEGVGNDVDPAGRNASFSWNYRGPSINSDINAPTSSLVPTDVALQQIFAWFNANGGTNMRPFRTPPSVPGVESKLDPNGLKSPDVKEWTLGLGSAIGSRGYVRADLVSRKWGNFYASIVNTSTGKVTDKYGTTYDQAIITNDNHYYNRKYTAVQMQGRYKILPQLNFGGTYTWSRLVGNVTGETSGNGPTAGVAGERPEYRQASWNYPTGYLTQDQRHRLRAWLSYDINTRVGLFDVSLLQNYDSGGRYSVVGTVDPSPYVTNPGYVSPVTSPDYFFGGRGSLKTDNISRTDLALNYKVQIFGGLELFLQPEIINVLNRQGVKAVDQEVLTESDVSYLKAFNPFTTKPIECPQGAAAATCTSMNANFQKGPNFGKPNSEGDYQTPRTYRFSVGLRF